VNTYAYDSANRLASISGGQSATYGYNGLGDRLSQNGVNYTLDLNTGLTQVLSDGTNTYLYGAGRIAQVNTTTEYFLGDALGSVRQLTDAGGVVTYANTYDPYGVTTQTFGASQTSFGFTGEYSDSYIKLIYLRSRLYDPLTGRFTTKDSWQGDYNRPLSLNRWNYVRANPINYVDPTGQRDWCAWWWNEWAVKQRVDVAESIVSPNADAINTYVAAGIAIQCAGSDNFLNANSGIGPAQITRNQARTEYGKVIPERYWWGGIVYDANGNPKPRNWGLACPDTGELETPLDPMDNQSAVILMRMLLQLVIDECKGCTTTDIYIAVAMAQNGPGFNRANMNGIPNASPENQNKYLIKKDWLSYFTADAEDGNMKNTKTQIDRFTLVINELKSRGWYVPENQPDFSWTTIELLRNW
jgi:RHS repeat-associated protein